MAEKPAQPDTKATDGDVVVVGTTASYGAEMTFQSAAESLDRLVQEVQGIADYFEHRSADTDMHLMIAIDALEDAARACRRQAGTWPPAEDHPNREP